MDEDTNKTKTSGLNNVLGGVGIIILGVPFFLISLVGPILPGSRTPVIPLIIFYGIFGYILGKMKPNWGWTSGLRLALGPISVAIALTFAGMTANFLRNSEIRNLILLTGIITIVSMASSYLGSRSKKAQQGPILNIAFAVFVFISVSILIGLVQLFFWP